MVRQTSIEAYRVIKNSNLLGHRQQQVYELLFEHGPLTYNQIYERLKESSGGAWTGINSSRLSELRRMGVVCEVGTAKDPYSGMEVIMWDVTEKVPVKSQRQRVPQKKQIETAKDLIKRLITRIDAGTYTLDPITMYDIRQTYQALETTQVGEIQ